MPFSVVVIVVVVAVVMDHMMVIMMMMNLGLCFSVFLLLFWLLPLL